MKMRFSMRKIMTFGWLSAVVIACVALGIKLASWDSVEVALQTPMQALSQLDQIIIPTPERLFGKPDLRMLVVGLDYDYDPRDQETSKSARSDIIMALNLDTKNHRISELSIPRDMIATLPSGQQAKINQAQSEGGIAESRTVVAKWLGIERFDRHVVLRIDTARDLIDAIGGIDVNVENSDALRNQGKNGPVDYDDNWGHLHVHLKPGLQHLDGEHAVGYARFRHDWCSDPCRIMRQQQIMHAVAEKLQHNQFNTLTHLQSLAAVFRRDVDTDLNPQEELSLAMSFAHVNPRDIRTSQVPYTDTVMLPDYGDSLVPDEQAKRRLVASMFPAPDIASGRAIRVCVENGTPVAGLAARVGGELRAKGFTISELRDAPRSDVSVTEIHNASENAAASVEVKQALGEDGSSANILSSSVPDDAAANSSDVTIVLGKDIIGTAR